MNEVLQTIFDRRSIRAYQDAPVPEDALETVIQAGLAAPSAMNQQSWHFVVLTGDGARRYRAYCQEKLGPVAPGTCWIHCVNDLFREESAAAEWGVPAGYRPVGSVAIGLSAGARPEAKPRAAGTVTRIS